MYLQVGNRKIKHCEILFLAEIADFHDRKIYIFKNPDNDKIYIVLYEVHIESGKVYQQKLCGAKAIRVLERERTNLLYTSYDIAIQKGKPYAWVYGENKEIRNKQGDIVRVEVKRCDFWGQKETICVVENEC